MDQSPPRRSGSPPRNADGSSINSPLNTPSRRHFASPPGSRGNRADAGTVYSDRFIPSRLSTNLEDAFDMMENRESLSKDYVRGDVKHENQAFMSNLLRSELLGQSVVHNTDPRMDGQIGSPARKEGSSSNLFKYRTSQGSASTSSASHHNGGGSLDSNHSTNSNSDYQNSPAGFGVVQSPDRRRSLNSPKKPVRKISKTPYKVLDAPSLQDDYYLNLVDWSHNNVLSVALGSSVYLWSACTSKVTKLCDLGADDSVTSISWATTGSNISVGTNSGKILIWDAAQCKLVREMAGHDNRVGTMAWNSTLLASGSRDRNILLQDIRVRGHSSGGGGSGASSGNTSTSSHLNTSQHHNNTNTSTSTAVRGYSSVQYTYGSPGRASTGGINGMSGGVNVNRSLMSNVTAAIHPQGSIRRSSEGYLYSPSHSSSMDSMGAASGASGAGSGSLGSASRRHSSGYHTDSPMLTDSVFGSMLAGSSSGGIGGGIGSGMSSASSSLLDVTTGLYDPPPLVSASHSVRRPHPALPITTSPSRATAATDPCVVRELCAHKQEVCGLKWSFDEKMLASGGNDNKLFVWDATHGSSNSGGSGITEPLCSFTDHTAAVKAVAWSPHQHGLLASGGGTADRHIRFWNALTGVPLHKIDTGSQVCNLMWSKNVNEIVSTHGYSLNQVIVWKYPSMQKIATLTGHTLRVLYLAMSPDGQSIVTGAGDETLRFWNIFPGPRNKSGFHIGPSALTPNGSDIR